MWIRSNTDDADEVEAMVFDSQHIDLPVELLHLQSTTLIQPQVQPNSCWYTYTEEIIYPVTQ